MKLEVNINGLGVYIPKKVLTNQDLEKVMDTTDEWILTRTGISSRHILADDENASDAGYYAAVKAIEDAKIHPEEITHIIVATCTPDNLSPSVSCCIAGRLGLSEYSGVAKISPTQTGLISFDINAACSGFVYGLEISRSILALHPDATILLVATEALSRRMNYQDRSTAVLFGDGAGAMILQRKGTPFLTIQDVSLGSDGGLKSLISIGGGTSMKVTCGDIIDESFFVTMQGREVFKHAVRCMVQECEKIMIRNDLSIHDIDLFIAHQANMRILEAVTARLEIDESKVFINLPQYGNTSAASILLALSEAREKGLIHRGKPTLLTTFGAGLTWGSALLS